MVTVRLARSGHGGFTLVELLVVLAILAALAGVIVPVVTGQIRKSDVTRTTTDLTNLRTGVESFIVDLRRYPGDVEDLGTAPTAASSTDVDVNSAQYPSGLASKWDGPYVDDVIADGDSLVTGFGGWIFDDFTTATLNGASYLTIQIGGVGYPEFADLDQVIDATVDSTAGRLRFTLGPPTLVRYLAIPIN